MKPLIFAHLITIIPVIIMGPFILWRKKGDRLHKLLGRVWVSCMVISCFLSFGIRHNGQLSWLHGLAAFTIWSMYRGVQGAREGDLKKHYQNMKGPYIGALIAMLFAFSSRERMLGEWIRSLF